MEYRVDGRTYSLSYDGLRQKHAELCELGDVEFLDRLPEALHLACVVCWLKERGQSALSDRGIVHELVHLLHIPDEPLVDVAEIRQRFRTDLHLAP